MTPLSIGGRQRTQVGPFPRHSGLRTASASPAERGGAVGAPKRPRKVAPVSVAHLPADLLRRKIGLDQEAPRLGHAALGDPPQDGPPRFAPNHRGEVPWREAHRSSHVLERDGFAVALLDEAEDLGQLLQTLQGAVAWMGVLSQRSNRGISAKQPLRVR